MEILIVVAYILGTLTGVLVYRQGLKDKKPLNDTGVLAPIIKRKLKETPLTNDVIGLNNIMAFDGTEQKDDE